MWWDYEPSKPRQAKGGIKAQSKRGQFGQTWWAKRWLKALESFIDSNRLSRGRSYARSGQVLSLDIEQGLVKAKVQGSRPKPYQVTIHVAILTQTQWQSIAQAFSKQLTFTAQLLSGEMPKEIETLFETEQFSLLPNCYQDLETQCSCPDWSNPCKHVAAVYYLIGEELDRDPFLIFKMRGIDRETFIQLLTPTRETSKQIIQEEPLVVDPKVFWAGHPLQPIAIKSLVAKPLQTASLCTSLGKFPLWQGEELFIESLQPIYQQVANEALIYLSVD
jgi:uncharacterized Zn finger protein